MGNELIIITTKAIRGNKNNIVVSRALQIPFVSCIKCQILHPVLNADFNNKNKRHNIHFG